MRDVCWILALSFLWASPAFAQAAVGGPSKQKNYVGGAAAQTNPVVPPRRGQATGSVQTHPSATRR